MLGIRLLLAYEFGVAGLEKRRGGNGFADIQEAFPFPFAITAERPYRGAIPVGEAIAMMEKERGVAIDGACLRAWMP